MKFVRISSLIIGLSMIFQWMFFLITKNVPQVKTAPIEISFHITIEIITALILILIFVLLKKPTQWKIYFSIYGQGMLGYTVVNSSGYFAQSGNWLFIMMFAILLILSILNTVKMLRINI